MTKWLSRMRYAFILIAGLAIHHGLYAQCANTTTLGVNSTCFGNYSMVNSAGIFDTAFGSGTLNANSAGAANTAVGAWALGVNTTGSYNTGIGHNALTNNSTGNQNTSLGSWSLANSTTADGNTALGFNTLGGTTTGAYNAATGYQALSNDTTGGYNVATGANALAFSSTGIDNSAVGASALANLATGNANLALGVGAGVAYSGSESFNVLLASNGVAGESNVMRLGAAGVQTKAFVAGVHGVTSASGVPVYVNSSGQLGTTTSSVRFKEDVADMGTASDELLKLRPVTFRYKAPYDDGQRVLQYGLIAEEVAEVDPNLVQFGDDGQPLTVRYHFVNAMLLGEVQKQHATLANQSALLAQQTAEIASQKLEIAALAARLAKLEAATTPKP
jgi:hypothetical protein